MSDNEGKIFWVFVDSHSHSGIQDESKENIQLLGNRTTSDYTGQSVFGNKAFNREISEKSPPGQSNNSQKLNHQINEEQ